MIPKIKRLNTTVFEDVYKKGRVINLRLFSVRFIKTDGKDFPSIGISVPKTLIKTAVSRNKIKRVLYDIALKVLKEKRIKIIFIIKKDITFLSKDDIENEIRSLSI